MLSNRFLKKIDILYFASGTALQWLTSILFALNAVSSAFPCHISLLFTLPCLFVFSCISFVPLPHFFLLIPRRILAHSRTDGSNLTPLSHRFWSFLAWRYPLGRNSEIQNFLALGPLGGVLWAFQNFVIFGYRQPLNGHNFWSTNDRKLVLVSNIMFWDELSEKNF